MRGRKICYSRILASTPADLTPSILFSLAAAESTNQPLGKAREVSVSPKIRRSILVQVPLERVRALRLIRELSKNLKQAGETALGLEQNLRDVGGQSSSAVIN